MKKSDLIERIARRSPGLELKQAKRAVAVIIETMADRLSCKWRIKIHNFGSFGLTLRRSRVARNPMSGEKFQLAERYVPRFRIGKELRIRVNAARTECSDD
jgi:integration host factor subunit beta